MTSGDIQKGIDDRNQVPFCTANLHGKPDFLTGYIQEVQ